MKKHFVRFVACFILCSIPVFCSAGQFIIKQLGFIQGDSGSAAIDINNSGVVLGWSGDATHMSSTLWTQPNNLESISGSIGSFSVNRINNAGYAVGYMTDPTTGNITAAVRNSEGNISQKQIGSMAYSINDNLTVVGTLGYNVYVWQSDGTIVDLGGDANYTVTGMEVNNSGAVVWSCRPIYQTGATRSFVWNGAGDPVELVSLNQMLGSQVTGINNFGQIAGYSSGHAVVWNALGSIISDLGLGEAYGINDLGQVVGISNNGATLWNRDGSPVDLGLGESSWAAAINDKGWIVGGVRYPASETPVMAVLWQPVPEPSALVVLVCGLVAITSRARKRKSL